MTNDSIINPGSEGDESSSLKRNVSAKLFASPSNYLIISDACLYDTGRENHRSNHIEMLSSLCLNASPEAESLIDDFYEEGEICTTINSVKKIPTLKKELYQLLLNIEEKHNRLLESQDEVKNTTKPISDQ